MLAKKEKGYLEKMIRVRFELTPSFEDQELLVKVTLTWRLGPLGHLTALPVVRSWTYLYSGCLLDGDGGKASYAWMTHPGSS